MSAYCLDGCDIGFGRRCRRESSGLSAGRNSRRRSSARGTTADCGYYRAAFWGQRGGIPLQAGQCPRALWIDLQAMSHVIAPARGTKRTFFCLVRLRTRRLTSAGRPLLRCGACSGFGPRGSGFDCTHRRSAFRGERAGISLQAGQCPRAVWIDPRAMSHVVASARGTKCIYLRFAGLSLSLANPKHA
jgi:hypothetical protein